MTTLALPEEPELAFRQLHHELHAFASQTMDDDDALAFMTRLLDHETQLLAPVALSPPQQSERQALQSESKVLIAGKSIDVSPLIQQEILKLSDEFQASEARCVELWFLASDAGRREWVERVDQLPAAANATSIPAAARHFLISEVECKLNLLKELMRLRFDDRLDKKRRQFVLSFTNKLLAEGLLIKLLSSFEDQLPKLLELTPMQQPASYWHDLLADTALFIVSSVRVLPNEIQKLVEVLKALCGQLNSVVAKVSPHIVNLTSFGQLFESGSLAGTSPQGVVKQVSCMLRAMTTIQVALLVVLLEKRTDDTKVDRDTGAVSPGNALSGAANAHTVRNLHRLIMHGEWEYQSFQSVTMLAWAAFLGSQIDPSGANASSTASSNVLNLSAVSGNVFAEVEQTPRVVKAALEHQVFTCLVDIVLKYLPDARHDPLLYSIFEDQLESLFVNYSSKLMVDVPTLADQAALAQMQSDSDGEVVSWDGDCLENIVEFAIALCNLDPFFARSFWPSEDNVDSGPDTEIAGEGNSHEFLLACRDAAFKNPASLSPYLKLVAAAAEGSECAQLAFHHMKQNPAVLSWDHFFAVMSKYQRLLTEAERPNANYTLLSGGIAASSSDISRNSAANNNPGPKFIRPKELEALEAIQAVIQGVIQDPQLALIFFHNHDWSPIQSFVTFLQCRVPSSLKGELMKTLSLFAQVPEIAPFVWRQMDSLQILRTTADIAVYGNQDISYELEHFESLSRRYPATRGFLALLDELFDNPHAWNAFEGDGRVAAIQYYFDFLLEKVFLKFDIRKYESEDEKWALVNGVLGIFRRVLRQRGATLAEGSFAYQLLQRLLAGGPLLEKLLSILSSEGGVDSLESTASNVHLEHAFFFCLDYSKKQAEAAYGALTLSGETVSSKRRKPFVSKDPWRDHRVSPRQRSVQHALEIIVLVLEKDAHFVHSDIHRQLAVRAQVEMLHSILFRYRRDFVNIIQYVKFTKSAYIAELSVAILRAVSNRVPGHALVDLLVDSGASGDVMVGYMNRLLNVYDDDDSDEVDSHRSIIPLVDHDDENGSGSVKFQTPKKRRGREHKSSTSGEITISRAAGSSIRSIILDLLLDNLEKPAPNLAHLLLGVLNADSSVVGGSGYLSSGLDVVLTLLSTPDFGFELPNLAQKCYKIIHQLVVQEFSSSTVISVLESPQCHFFETQLRLFAGAFHLKHRRNGPDVVGELNMRGWFFKALSVYVHTSIQKEPTHIKRVNRLMSLLLLAADDADPARQSRMLLLRLLNETTYDLYPPEVPANQQAVTLAEQVTQTVDEGYFKWLKIDVERFCEVLQAADFESLGGGAFSAFTQKRMRSSFTGAGSSPASASPTDSLLQWAISWNLYSERVAAESHALNSLRELVEVIVLDYLSIHEDTNNDQVALWMGLDAIASGEVRAELISGIISTVLVKVNDRPRGSAQLFEIVSKLLLLLFSEVRRVSTTAAPHESRSRQYSAYVELLVKAVGNTTTATGNPVAAQNARTLLYSCLVNLLTAISSSSSESDAHKFLQSGGSLANPSRGSLLTGPIVDLVCRDASESGDVLSMGLAVSGLEAMLATSGAVVTKALRERGYLLHFIGLFRQLCEMDASFDRDPSSNGIASKHTPPGVDATTIGTVYECFVSLFTRVASKPEGAVALLEGGLVRILSEVHNLPSHRPKLIFRGDNTVSMNSDAFRRAETIYSRKWIPLVRLVSTICASLPQNRALAQQALQLIGRQKKLFTGCLKLDQHDKPSLTLLRETSYSTFVFRYVAQFPDLCDKELSIVKWDKISQAILRVFLLYASEVIPPKDDEDQMNDNDSVWWAKTQPRLPNEYRDDGAPRLQTSELEEELLERSESARAVMGLLRLSVFSEEKLYTSRMIVCNTVAFCGTRMLKSVDVATRLLPGKNVLLAACVGNSSFSTTRFASVDSVDRRSFVGSMDPLWAHAPAISEFALRLKIAIEPLEACKTVDVALKEISLQRRPGRSIDTADVAYVKNLIEYNADSLSFVIENMAIVLFTHFSHYLSHQSDSSKTSVQPVLRKVLETLGTIENNSFVHAIARRLRELASSP